MLDILRRFRADLPVSDAEWEAMAGLAWHRLLLWEEEEEVEEEEEEGDSSNLFLSHALPRSSWTPAVVCSWLVLLFWCFSRCIPFVCRQDSAARHHGRSGPEGQLCSGLVLLVFCTWRCIRSCRLQATDACHHDRYGPEGAVRGAVQKTAEIPQLQFIMVVDFPVVTQRLIPTVLLTIRDSLVVVFE